MNDIGDEKLQDNDDDLDESTRARGAAGPGLEKQLNSFMTELAGVMTGNAMQLAARTYEVPLRMARAVFAGREPGSFAPDHLKMMHDAGMYLRDLRQVAGLTVNDLGEALDMRDTSVLEAAEAGTATLPFETILRLASLVARNDPVPFVLRLMRSYNPEAWQALENWGIGRIPLQLGREREFLNIYRSHDEARTLSDDGYARVLEFTRTAFQMALHFVAASEQREGEDQDQ